MIVTGRRELLAILGMLPLLAAAGSGSRALPRMGPRQAFSWAMLQRQAAALAGRPFRPQPPVAAADAHDFDTFNAIRFRPEATVANAVRLFPLTRSAPTPVRIHLIEGGTARELLYTPDLFEAPAGSPGGLGLSGFRALYPGKDNDWLAFLGASYFRAPGPDGQFGLSARAVAIDTGIDGAEEFPSFTTFWLEPHGRERVVVHALLDGPSVTGAFRYDSRLTAEGVIQDVSSVLHLRRDVARLGIAPSTSMFWYGEGDRAAATDWRPEIHDSDGLAMHTGAGERIWRPLVNPRVSTINSFTDRDPKGFGLIQRDRNFEHYQDDGAFYDRRPNLWVEPVGKWGGGSVALYAFPTAGETTDNVVAFWVPAEPARAGARLAFDYKLSWTAGDPATDAPSRVVATRLGTGGRPGVEPVAGQRKLVVDFAGPALKGLDLNSGVRCTVDVAHGREIETHAYPVVGRPALWRVTVDVEATGTVPADVRLWLGRNDAALSETIVIPVS
jgi:glucans biosynthesis protein